MKTHAGRLGIVAVLAGAVCIGCGRQTRGSADADDRSRAATPAEGGATETRGSAGTAKEFGDTDAKKAYDEASPSGKTITGGGSTAGPGATEKKDVTIQTGGTQK